jgi:hypothetical protein
MFILIVFLGLAYFIYYSFAKKRKGEYSGSGCGIRIALAICIALLSLLINKCGQDAEEKGELLKEWKDKTACDCVQALKNGYLDSSDLYQEGIIDALVADKHPCNEIISNANMNSPYDCD